MSDVTCKEAKEKVYDYLAQEVDDDTKTSINGHLKDCVTCAGEYAIELQISSFISSSSLSRISTEELVSRAYLQIESEEEA
jgi:anti-sigma factor (TIGR02949 family)